MRALLLALCCLSLAPASAQELRVCYEDKDTYDHTGTGTAVPEQPGVIAEMVAMLPTRLPQLRVSFQRKPWARCLAELETGAVDAVFSSSFKPERLKIGVYPMRDGKEDRRYRIDTKSYSLYKLSDSPLNWDGTSFSPSAPALIAMRGYAVVDDLRKLGVTVNEINLPEEGFRMLLAGRIDGFAQLSDVGDYLLRKNRDFARIVKLPTPISTKDYYLQVSHQFAQRFPALPQEIWRALADIRQAEAEKLLAKYMRSYSNK